MMTTVLENFNTFVFDVDRTIAPNNEQIATPIIQKLQSLVKQANIAIVTSRSIHEGLELLAHAFFQIKTDYQLYFFTCSAGQAYSYDFMTGGLLKRYDKAKSDTNFQQYYQNFQQSLSAHHIDIVEPLDCDEAMRQARVQDRGAQVTLFFSNAALREEYESVLRNLGVSFIHHGRNTLHVVPAGVDKHLAINYLDEEDGRFLVFADAFYDFPETGRRGNDLAFTDLLGDKVTCINVGRDIPKIGSGVFYFPNADLEEWELTNYVLDKILQECSFEALELVQIK